jgi:antibiotic biosynthesis monooxygenase (ABM) superfamily enzyme
MNPFWKEVLIISTEVGIVSLILYDMIRKIKDPKERLSLFLMSILLLILVAHLVINSKNMMYNFGLWFYCRHH